MDETGFWEIVEEIRAREPGYRREAYGFVMAALGTRVQTLPAERRGDPARRHLTGQELMEGVIALARREFGQLAPAVFAEWGMRAGEDVGRIVFQLVESGQLSARPEDTIEDFRQVTDLLGVLRENLPIGRDRSSDPRAGNVTRSGPETAA